VQHRHPGCGATLAQISRLAEAGCELVRLAVLDQRSVKALAAIKGESSIPIIADIHFDHRLALGSLAAGVDGLRLNPGNIGGERAVSRVVRAAAERRVPIRIGVNSGSLDKDLLSRTAAPRRRPWWRAPFARFASWKP